MVKMVNFILHDFFFKFLGAESRSLGVSQIYGYPPFHSNTLSLFGADQWIKRTDSESQTPLPHTSPTAVYLEQYAKQFSVPSISLPVRWE